MRLVGTIVVALVLAPAALAVRLPADPGATMERIISYRAHDGKLRSAWLLYPVSYDGRPLPLVISPHGRGCDARANARLWGDLPGQGRFAVVNPEGEGRRLGLYSWGDPGQISDLARMPQIVEHAGIRVLRHRVYAFGGSMGGQETLLLAALHPHLLAGAAAFDPPTDMARRYWDFARLPGGAALQREARTEIGGTPLTDPTGYAVRSPDSYARQLALSGVPLQLYWSTRDRVISDQTDETGVLIDEILGWNPHAKVASFRGQWHHTAEMRPWARLPRALARFGLLPWWLAPKPNAAKNVRTRRI